MYYNLIDTKDLKDSYTFFKKIIIDAFNKNKLQIYWIDIKNMGKLTPQNTR